MYGSYISNSTGIIGFIRTSIATSLMLAITLLFGASAASAQTYSNSIDNDNDGKPEQVITFFDGDDNGKYGIIRIKYDGDENGKFETEEWLFDLDENDKFEAKTLKYDLNENGKVENTTYKYDKDENGPYEKIKYTYDKDENGKIELTVYQYDKDQNNVVEKKVKYVNQNEWGPPNSIETSYDQDQNKKVELIINKEDTNKNNIINEYIYKYDGELKAGWQYDNGDWWRCYENSKKDESWVNQEDGKLDRIDTFYDINENGKTEKFLNKCPYKPQSNYIANVKMLDDNENGNVEEQYKEYNSYGNPSLLNINYVWDFNDDGWVDQYIINYVDGPDAGNTYAFEYDDGEFKTRKIPKGWFN